MEESQEIDLFDMFGLDRDNEMIVSFVSIVSETALNLYRTLEEKKTPALVFNECVMVWEFYSIMPESVRAQCEGLVKYFSEMWDDVAGEEAEYFLFLCDKIMAGTNDAEEQLCVISFEILEAITVLDGGIPETARIFAASMNVLKSGNVNSNACVALLYILCARIWYRSFGYSSDEEDVLLSEGIKYHMKAKAGDIIGVTELYAIHIAAAIEDIISIRSERGITQNDVLMLAKEGYTVLERFDSPQIIFARQSLYESSGISAETALNGEKGDVSLSNNGKKCMAN